MVITFLLLLSDPKPRFWDVPFRSAYQNYPTTLQPFIYITNSHSLVFATLLFLHGWHKSVHSHAFCWPVVMPFYPGKSYTQGLLGTYFRTARPAVARMHCGWLHTTLKELLLATCRTVEEQVILSEHPRSREGHAAMDRWVQHLVPDYTFENLDLRE